MASNRNAVVGAVVACAAIAVVVVLRMRVSVSPSRADAVMLPDSEPKPSRDTVATELASLPVEESVLAPLPAGESADTRAVATPHDTANKDATYYQRKVLTDNIALLSAPDTTLDSVPVRLVLFQSIALSLDAQGRGIHRTKDEGVKVKSQPGQNHFMYNGGVYVFEPNEFPEFDAFTRNRKSRLSDPEARDVISLVRERGEAALASLPPPK